MDADRTVDFTLEHTGIPPYAGTVFITPDVLGPSDPTSLRGVTYAGRGQREIYDRRPDRWITVNAYLFTARYAGQELEFQVNPEFGSREAARAEVDTYAPALGRLPAVLLSRAREVEINAGKELFGGNEFNRSFLIHTNQGREYIRNGFLEEVFLHEAGHVSLDLAHANSAGWRSAQEADGVFISDYARDFPDTEKTSPRASCRTSLCGTGRSGWPSPIGLRSWPPYRIAWSTSTSRDSTCRPDRPAASDPGRIARPACLIRSSIAALIRS